MGNRYPETTQNANETAKAALARMSEHGIACNPNNFAIWYEYVSGVNPDLTRAIDILLSNRQEVTPQRNDEIYDRFFGRPDPQTHEVGGRIETAAQKILRALSTLGTDTESYREALAAFSGGLEGAESISDVETLITDITSETRTMNDQIVTLQSEVSASTEEIGELKRKLEEARREAMTDGLTGIANRKCFDERLRMAAAEAMETGTPLSLVMTDLDHFKKFNDQHGHPVGDQVLKLVGTTLIQNIKGKDTAARYGGEEFALILPDTDLSGAQSVAETIRQAVASKRLYKRGSDTPLGTITLSLGVATYRPGEPIDELVRRTDEALYFAKNTGRNRVGTEGERGVVSAAAT